MHRHVQGVLVMAGTVTDDNIMQFTSWTLIFVVFRAALDVSQCELMLLIKPQKQEETGAQYVTVVYHAPLPILIQGYPLHVAVRQKTLTDQICRRVRRELILISMDFFGSKLKVIGALYQEYFYTSSISGMKWMKYEDIQLGPD